MNPNPNDEDDEPHTKKKPKTVSRAKRKPSTLTAKRDESEKAGGRDGGGASRAAGRGKRGRKGASETARNQSTKVGAGKGKTSPATTKLVQSESDVNVEETGTDDERDELEDEREDDGVEDEMVIDPPGSASPDPIEVVEMDVDEGSTTAARMEDCTPNRGGDAVESDRPESIERVEEMATVASDERRSMEVDFVATSPTSQEQTTTANVRMDAISNGDTLALGVRDLHIQPRPVEEMDENPVSEESYRLRPIHDAPPVQRRLASQTPEEELQPRPWPTTRPKRVKNINRVHHLRSLPNEPPKGWSKTFKVRDMTFDVSLPGIDLDGQTRIRKRSVTFKRYDERPTKRPPGIPAYPRKTSVYDDLDGILRTLTNDPNEVRLHVVAKSEWDEMESDRKRRLIGSGSVYVVGDGKPRTMRKFKPWDANTLRSYMNIYERVEVIGSSSPRTLLPDRLTNQTFADHTLSPGVHDDNVYKSTVEEAMARASDENASPSRYSKLKLNWLTCHPDYR